MNNVAKKEKRWTQAAVDYHKKQVKEEFIRIVFDRETAIPARVRFNNDKTYFEFLSTTLTTR